MPFLHSLRDGAGIDVFRAFPETSAPLIEFHEVLPRAPSPFTAGERARVLAQLSEDQTSGRFPLAIHPTAQLENGANALEDNVVVYKVESGRRSPLGPVGRSDDYGVKLSVPAERWSTLGVVFDGARFTVSFDGEPIFEVVDATFTEPGRVGLWTKADSVTCFDGFEIEAR